jgi:hypothetical protein
MTLEVQSRTRDLAMFNLAIGSKLRKPSGQSRSSLPALHAGGVGNGKH